MPLKGGIFTVQKLSQDKADFKQCKLQGTFHWSFSFCGRRVLTPVGLEICEVCWLQPPAVSPHDHALPQEIEIFKSRAQAFPSPESAACTKPVYRLRFLSLFFAQALLSLLSQHAVNSWKPVSHFDHIRWLRIFLF